MVRLLAGVRVATRSFGALLRPRALLERERGFLRCEFGESLELDTLRIAGGGHPIGRIAWQPAAALIQLADECFEHGDPSGPVRQAAYPILAHEALHVWQRVHGQCRVSVSVDGLWLGVMRGRAAYHYDQTVREPAQVLAVFLAANIEQQGQIFEDYVRSDIDRVEARDPRFADVAAFVLAQRRRARPRASQTEDPALGARSDSSR